MSKKKRKNFKIKFSSGGLDKENRIEEAVYELRRIISEGNIINVNKTIHKICSKWEVKQGEVRNLWHKNYFRSPEKIYRDPKGREIDIKSGEPWENIKKINQNEAWRILSKLASDARFGNQL